MSKQEEAGSNKGQLNKIGSSIGLLESAKPGTINFREVQRQLNNLKRAEVPFEVNHHLWVSYLDQSESEQQQAPDEEEVEFR